MVDSGGLRVFERDTSHCCWQNLQAAAEAAIQGLQGPWSKAVKLVKTQAQAVLPKSCSDCSSHMLSSHFEVQVASADTACEQHRGRGSDISTLSQVVLIVTGHMFSLMVLQPGKFLGSDSAVPAVTAQASCFAFPEWQLSGIWAAQFMILFQF